MTTSRRDFLRWSAAGSFWALSAEPGFAGAMLARRPRGGLKILILGGTGFLGPHLVDSATKRGHTVTLFNRGKTNPQLFPDVEKLHGDRDGNLKALEKRQWDAVIDTSGYVPRIVRASAELLKDSVKQYVFISTISVYADFAKASIDESYPVGKIADETTEQVSNTAYGPLKALCEQAAEKAMPGRVTNVRPGLIVGPRDDTDRFAYWPVRVDRGGTVLAPGTPDDPVQFIDVRDLADWCVHTIEKRVVGVFNATGPKDRLTTADLLEECKAVTGSDAEFTWVDAPFLQKHQVSVPVWVPPDPQYGHMNEVSVARAVQNGLTFRPLADTVKDTLAWWKGLGKNRLMRGLTAKREAEVLAAWQTRDKAG